MKQPFYHRVELIFTTTNGLDKNVEDAIRKAIEKLPGYVKGTLCFEVNDSEAGDPTDLDQ
jgi:hypothetical protein